MSKYQRNRAQDIQKEQLRLVKVENILTKILANVNESINELKVEELHIKSRLIEHYTSNHDYEEPSTSAQAALRMNESTYFTEPDHLSIQKSQSVIDMEGFDDINKQILAVESLLVPIKQNKFQEEEEDDDDDDYEPTETSESDEEENTVYGVRLKNKPK